MPPGGRVQLAIAALLALVAVHAGAALAGGGAPEVLGLNLANLAAFGATALVLARAVSGAPPRTWLPLATGMVAYSAGFVVYGVAVARHEGISTPSPADALW